MEFQILKCPACGSDKSIERNGEVCRCGYCGTEFMERLAKREYEKLHVTLRNEMGAAIDEALLRMKTEKYYNLRSILWDKIHANHLDSRAIVDTCEEILAIAPHDFLAEFFEVANTAKDESIVAKKIAEIDVKSNESSMEPVLDFIISSLKEEYITPTAALLDKCTAIFTPEKKQKYFTRFEEEAKKVKMGIYDLNITRDVFIAYSSQDMTEVVKILNLLEGEGLTCFAAFRNLQHGKDSVANYESALRKAMDNCDIFLYISSVHSRSTSCDAYSKEISYIKKKEMDAHPEYRSYNLLPDKFRKLRIEYRLDNIPTRLVERDLESFFLGLTYAETHDQLIDRVIDCRNKLNGIENDVFIPDDFPISVPKPPASSAYSQPPTNYAQSQPYNPPENHYMPSGGYPYRSGGFADWISGTSTWLYLAPAILLLLIMTARLVIGQFLFPNLFMILLYSVCALSVYIMALIVRNRYEIWKFIYGICAFSIFSAAVFFGGAVPGEWCSIPTVIVLIAVSVIIIATATDDFGILITDPMILSTLLFIIGGVFLAVASITKLFAISFPKAADLGTFSIPNGFFIAIYAIAALLCVIMTYVDYERDEKEGVSFFWSAFALIYIAITFIGGYLPIPATLVMLLISVFLIVMICVSFIEDEYTSDLLSNPLTWCIALVAIAAVTILSLHFSGIFEFRFASYHLEFGTTPSGEPYDPVNLPKWLFIAVYAISAAMWLFAAYHQAVENLGWSSILITLLATPILFLIFFNGYIIPLWIQALVALGCFAGSFAALAIANAV